MNDVLFARRVLATYSSLLGVRVVRVVAESGRATLHVAGPLSQDRIEELDKGAKAALGPLVAVKEE